MKTLEKLNGSSNFFFFFSVQTSTIPALRDVGDKRSITSALEFLLPMMVKIVALI